MLELLIVEVTRRTCRFVLVASSFFIFLGNAKTCPCFDGTRTRITPEKHELIRV